MDKSDPFHLFPYRAIVDHPPVGVVLEVRHDVLGHHLADAVDR